MNIKKFWFLDDTTKNLLCFQQGSTLDFLTWPLESAAKTNSTSSHSRYCSIRNELAADRWAAGHFSFGICVCVAHVCLFPCAGLRLVSDVFLTCSPHRLKQGLLQNAELIFMISWLARRLKGSTVSASLMLCATGRPPGPQAFTWVLYSHPQSLHLHGKCLTR